VRIKRIRKINKIPIKLDQNVLYGFWKAPNASKVFNCDETGVYFDVPPGKILSERGQSSAITPQQKHSARLTAVCTIRGDGVKLPLLFIVRGEPNGIIEKEELPIYPDGTLYYFDHSE